MAGPRQRCCIGSAPWARWKRPRTGHRLHIHRGIWKGTSAKFVVEDERGTSGRVKLGRRGEIRNGRHAVLWAAATSSMKTITGHTSTSADCHGSLAGASSCRRGHRHRARLERERPARNRRFDRARVVRAGSRDEYLELVRQPVRRHARIQRSQVMMALVNNWDLKAVNNAHLRDRPGERSTASPDLGATFGRTGNSFNAVKHPEGLRRGPVSSIRSRRPTSIWSCTAGPSSCSLSIPTTIDCGQELRASQAHSRSPTPTGSATAWTTVNRADRRLFPRRRILARRS
jgi:hypothetical protein